MIVFLGVVAVLAILAGYVGMQPGPFRITRSATITASPDTIRGFLVDFHASGWGQWSPWEGIDADLKRDYSGPLTGHGSVYEWKGTKAGQGRMEILEDTPGHVSIRLDFIKPVTAHNLTRFDLIPEGEGTRVEWTMSGVNGFAGKLFGLIFNMDKTVGKDFEKGLAALKAVSEARVAGEAGAG